MFYVDAVVCPDRANALKQCDAKTNYFSVLMIVPSGSSDNGSTGRSAHDDGYGTESGSNQKVHTVSKRQSYVVIANWYRDYSESRTLEFT